MRSGHRFIISASALVLFADLHLVEGRQAQGGQQGMRPPTRASEKRGDSRAARDNRKDPNHPGNNPDHPLKDPTKDPGADITDPNKSGQSDVLVLGGVGEWPWGELVYDQKYPTRLTVKNDCWSAETVGIFVNELPYISLPASVTVPPRSTRDVPFTINTPPPPPIPLGVPGTPKFHAADAFIDVKGSVVLWHPWRFDPECKPMREEYKVAGHIHFQPASGDEGGGAERIASPDACQVMWNTGLRPANLGKEQDCTDAIRKLAFEYRTRVLQALVDRDRATWAWLPAPEAIGAMSIEDLLAMKTRAQELIGGGR
jgi:hypothetical protein